MKNLKNKKINVGQSSSATNIPCKEGECDPRSTNPDSERFLTCSKCGKLIENKSRNTSHLGFS